MISITKQMKFEAAHVVRGATSKRCKYSVHGHSYVVEVTLSANKTDDRGMVVDFIELKPLKDFIDNFDHAMILWREEKQDIIDFFKNNFERVVIMNKNTTAENMASLFLAEAKRIFDTYNRDNGINYHVDSVRVWETTTGSATASSCDNEDKVIYITHQGGTA